VDILYIHNVDSVEFLNNPGIKEALQRLKEEKKARFIGFSTHLNMTTSIKDAAQSGFYDVILVAFNYSLSGADEFLNALQEAATKGIGLIAMKTQCSQYWYQENLPGNIQEFYKGKILQTAVLKWVLKHEFITTAIPGYTTFQQMEEDFSVACGLEYTSEEKKFLEDRRVKLALKSYCQQCSTCLPSCPMGVDIPALMRAHLYAVCYRNSSQAGMTLQGIPEGKNLKRCQSCETCRAACVNRVDIARRVGELKLIYG
jgi:predicted aldo/keto reductase-like oxidoreductase